MQVRTGAHGFPNWTYVSCSEPKVLHDHYRSFVQIDPKLNPS